MKLKGLSDAMIAARVVGVPVAVIGSAGVLPGSQAAGLSGAYAVGSH